MNQRHASLHVFGVIPFVIIRVATVGIQNSANSKPPFETEQTFDNRYNEKKMIRFGKTLSGRVRGGISSNSGELSKLYRMNEDKSMQLRN